MMTGITGTPGTGKTLIGEILASRGYTVVSATASAAPFITCYDASRDTSEIDLDAWVDTFPPLDGFVEGHLAHFLACDRVVVLRCHPAVLARRLETRKYGPEKVRENLEAEAVDVILIESVEEAGEERVLEIDTTTRAPQKVADLVAGFHEGTVPASLAATDWSEWLLSGGEKLS